MGTKLKHLADFEKILADYHIAPAGHKILHDAQLALLIGPSGSGRDTIINELVKTGEYYHLVSDTTRAPRSNNGVMEKNGVEYWFRTEKEFLADLKAGKLLEAEIIHGQQVSGISIRELKKAHELKKIAITNVDLNNTAISQVKADVFRFMVLPPSFEEWQRRIAGRGGMDREEHRRRLQTACQIFEAGLQDSSYIFIINDSLESAVEQIHQRTLAGMHDPVKQRLGRKVAENLLIETTSFLHRT